MLIEIYKTIYRLHNKGLSLWFVWVPAHVGVKGNEKVGMLAKQSLKSLKDLQIALSKTEAKSIIKDQTQKNMAGILGY